MIMIALACLSLVALLTAAALLRARPELDAASPAGSARRYRVYLSGLTRLLLIGVVCADLTLLLLALQLREIVPSSVRVTTLTWLPLTVAGGAFLYFGIRVGEAGHRLPPEPGEEQESGFV
ncbi:hypothetical protein AB0C27_49605 [Nonomuraea sp. NPDC048882]|uniref:hypothetical protein n=1 Tax=Nonomuraea sp. NPDC048882 TaxID=3154347 RepID=UPI00340C576C